MANLVCHMQIILNKLRTLIIFQIQIPPSCLIKNLSNLFQTISSKALLDSIEMHTSEICRPMWNEGMRQSC